LIVEISGSGVDLVLVALPGFGYFVLAMFYSIMARMCEQIVNESSHDHFMRFDIKSILTNTYENWPRIRQSSRESILGVIGANALVRIYWLD
jgi:hypothetical protein